MTDDLSALQRRNRSRPRRRRRPARLGRRARRHARPERPPDRAASRPRQDPARATPRARRRAEPAQGLAHRPDRGPPRRAGSTPHSTPAWPPRRLDPTLPPRPRQTGLIHPISRTMEEIAAIFGAMGCAIAEGPDVESRLDEFRRAEHPRTPPRARRPWTRSTSRRRATRRRRCCGRRPRRCRSAPC